MELHVTPFTEKGKASFIKFFGEDYFDEVSEKFDVNLSSYIAFLMISIKSHINTNTAQFKENKVAYGKTAEKLEGHLEESRFEGKDKHIDKARSRNKMLARERIEMVLDQDSPFLELLPLAGMERKGGFGAGGTNVSGIGIVSGKLCTVNSNVGTRKGGFSGLRNSFQRGDWGIGDITRENKLPTINLMKAVEPTYPIKLKYSTMEVKRLEKLLEDLLWA